MPTFTVGEHRAALVNVVVSPEGIDCRGELYLVSSDGVIQDDIGSYEFTSIAGIIIMSFDIDMPDTEGVYDVYIDIRSKGVLIGSYIGMEPITIVPEAVSAGTGVLRVNVKAAGPRLGQYYNLDAVGVEIENNASGVKQNGVTDVNGIISFTTEPGEYSVKCTPPQGYTHAQGELDYSVVIVQDGLVTELDKVFLEDEYTYCIAVNLQHSYTNYDESEPGYSRAGAGVLVEAYTVNPLLYEPGTIPSGEPISAFTDTDGEVRISIKTGYVVLRAQYSGYQDYLSQALLFDNAPKYVPDQQLYMNQVIIPGSEADVTAVVKWDDTNSTEFDIGSIHVPYIYFTNPTDYPWLIGYVFYSDCIQGYVSSVELQPHETVVHSFVERVMGINGNLESVPPGEYEVFIQASYWDRGINGFQNLKTIYLPPITIL